MTFVVAISSTGSPKPPGYPRVRTADDFAGLAEQVIQVHVTSAPFSDAAPVWPDGTYARRFRFALATEVTAVEFNVGAYGWEVVDAARRSATNTGNAEPLSPIRDGLDHFMRGYLAAKQQPYAAHPIRAELRNLGARLARAARFADSVQMTASIGQTNWADVPWIAFLDRRETTSTQRGVYPVLLFAADMSGVYLTFGQGVTDLKAEVGGLTAARPILRQQANEIWTSVGTGLPGFAHDDQIDLKSTTNLGRSYEPAVVAYRHYSLEALPTEQSIVEDVASLAGAYSRYVEAKNAAQPVLVVGASLDADHIAGGYQEAIEAHGAAAMWWSFPLSSAALDALALHPYIYI